MEDDVVRRDKIAAAKKKVWFALLLFSKKYTSYKPLVYFVALKLYAHAYAGCVTL